MFLISLAIKFLHSSLVIHNYFVSLPSISCKTTRLRHKQKNLDIIDKEASALILVLPKSPNLRTIRELSFGAHAEAWARSYRIVRCLAIPGRT